MNYQLHIKQSNKNLIDEKLWLYSKLFVAAVLLNTIAVMAGFAQPLLSAVNLLLIIGFIAVMLHISSKRLKVRFIKIEDDKIEYFCPETEEIQVINASDITKITTHFCKLKLHTPDEVHSLNLGLVIEEQKRREIKEMIQRMAHIDHFAPC